MGWRNIVRDVRGQTDPVMLLIYVVIIIILVVVLFKVLEHL